MTDETRICRVCTVRQRGRRMVRFDGPPVGVRAEVEISDPAEPVPTPLAAARDDQREADDALAGAEERS